MADHTPEPWDRVGNALIDPKGDTPDGQYQIAVFTGSKALANIERARACVNACAGIPTEALAAGDFVELVSAVIHYMDPQSDHVEAWDDLKAAVNPFRKD